MISRRIYCIPCALSVSLGNASLAPPDATSAAPEDAQGDYGVNTREIIGNRVENHFLTRKYGLARFAHPGTWSLWGSKILVRAGDLRYYRTITSAYTGGSALVLASFLYKSIIRVAQFVILRFRADVDNEVEILVLRHQPGIRRVPGPDGARRGSKSGPAAHGGGYR
jgi:hypothetical protein